jgi:hypothetical protein
MEFVVETSFKKIMEFVVETSIDGWRWNNFLKSTLVL